MNSTTLSKGRYLVTGGAGFIGSHLCERLLDLDCDVVSVDNFITGRPHNLRTLLRRGRFSHLEQDLVRGLKLDGGLAGIFHFASPASPVDYQNYPIETLHVGAVGTDNVLKLAVEKACPVLMASTSEVYGDPLQHPQKESYWGNVNPIGPRGCYDESKRYLEALTMAYQRARGARTRIVRIFNTYGPRMRTDDGRVVPNFCLQALKREKLTVYGEGRQTRSFCYVDDLVEGILRLMQCEHPEPVNLGNPTEFTILDFAKKIIALSESSSEIEYRPLPQDDPKTRCPDITRAKQLLGWEPKIGVDEGLKLTLDYFRARVEVQPMTHHVVSRP